MADDPNTVTEQDSKLKDWDLDFEDETETPTEPSAAVSVPADTQPSPTPPAEPVAGTADPTPSVQPPAPATPPATATSLPSEPASPDIPFAFKADGKALDIPGAVKLANGDLRVPAASLNHLQRHLADRGEWQRHLGERQRTETDLRTQLDTVSQTKNGLLERFQQVLDLAATDPEGLIAYALKARQELPQYVAEIRQREGDTEKEQLRRQLEEIQFERMLPQLEPVWQERVGQYVQQIVGADPVFTGMDAAALATYAWENRELGLLVRAPGDAPDGSFRKGDMAVDLELLRRLVQTGASAERKVIEARKQWESQQVTAQAAAKATQQNTATLAPPVVPQVRTGSKTVAVRQRQTVTAPRNADGTFATKADSFDDEWDKLDLSPD